MAARHNDTAPETAGARPAAIRFFWLWLVVATAMSIAGNVAHAVLVVEPATALLAASAALVPPVVLLAATHSVALLVRIRVRGAVYWCAVLMTLALAASAFVLSFTALREVAVAVGVPESIAWLWPCAIDVAIAQATLCLLSVGGRDSGARPDGAPGSMALMSESGKEVDSIAREAVPAPTPAAVDDEGPREQARSADPPRRQRAGSTASDRRWRDLAESLIRDGVTSKGTDLVATILAERDAGIPPSTIGRTHGVHHTTVNRILAAATASIDDHDPGPAENTDAAVSVSPMKESLDVQLRAPAVTRR